MAGNVYVLNVTSQDLALVLNGAPPACGAIPAWSGGPADRYRPNLGAIPRTLNAGDAPGKFFNGANQVTLSQPGGTANAAVAIDGRSLPLDQDLLLLVERNQWQLVTEFGIAAASGEVRPMDMLGEGAEQSPEA